MSSARIDLSKDFEAREDLFEDVDRPSDSSPVVVFPVAYSGRFDSDPTKLKKARSAKTKSTAPRPKSASQEQPDDDIALPLFPQPASPLTAQVTVARDAARSFAADYWPKVNISKDFVDLTQLPDRLLAFEVSEADRLKLVALGLTRACYGDSIQAYDWSSV